MEGFIARSHSAHFVSLDRANQAAAGGGDTVLDTGHMDTTLYFYQHRRRSWVDVGCV